MTVPMLDDVRQDANAKLNAFYGKAAGDRNAALSNPETARVKAVGLGSFTRGAGQTVGNGGITVLKPYIAPALKGGAAAKTITLLAPPKRIFINRASELLEESSSRRSGSWLSRVMRAEVWTLARRRAQAGVCLMLR
jgi:hypothetical protein